MPEPAIEAEALGSRHPFQVFTLALCLFVGVPLLIGDASPGSISALLPKWAENTWGLALVSGSGIALVSIYLRNRAMGLLFEQLGLALTSAATLFYTAVVLGVVGLDGAVAALFTLGFGLSCAWRWWQIQHLLNRASKEVRRRG